MLFIWGPSIEDTNKNSELKQSILDDIRKILMNMSFPAQFHLRHEQHARSFIDVGNLLDSVNKCCRSVIHVLQV